MYDCYISLQKENPASTPDRKDFYSINTIILLYIYFVIYHIHQNQKETL